MLWQNHTAVKTNKREGIFESCKLHICHKRFQFLLTDFTFCFYSIKWFEETKIAKHICAYPSVYRPMHIITSQLKDGIGSLTANSLICLAPDLGQSFPRVCQFRIEDLLFEKNSCTIPKKGLSCHNTNTDGVA